VEIHRGYAAVPTFAAPLAPEGVTTSAVVLWVVFGSTAAVAWRGSSLGQLAVRISVSSVLVASRLQVPAGYGYEIVWPVASFGLFVVVPLLLWRAFRVGASAFVPVDSWGVAALACFFVVDQYVPKL